jgi:hypothetical protein
LPAILREDYTPLFTRIVTCKCVRNAITNPDVTQGERKGKGGDGIAFALKKMAISAV